MQAFPMDPKLQTYACCILGNVFLQVSGEQKKDIPFVKQAIGTVITIMQGHISHSGVQCYGAHALAGLALESGIFIVILSISILVRTSRVQLFSIYNIIDRCMITIGKSKCKRVDLYIPMNRIARSTGLLSCLFYRGELPVYRTERWNQRFPQIDHLTSQQFVLAYQFLHLSPLLDQGKRYVMSIQVFI